MREGWNTWLLALGRLLPRRVREYVFEPACYDLVRETLERRRDARLLAPRLVGILLHVAVVNFPRVLFDDRRPSRLALLLGGLALITFLGLMAMVLVMRGAYGP